MPPNNNLRTVIAHILPLNNNLRTAQCRNYSTRCCCKPSSSGARRRIVASGGRSMLDGFISSIAYGNIAFACWASIEMLEYLRTVIRDLEERGGNANPMLSDLLKWLMK